MVVTVAGSGDNLIYFYPVVPFFNHAMLIIVGKRPKAIVFGESFGVSF